MEKLHFGGGGEANFPSANEMEIKIAKAACSCVRRGVFLFVTSADYFMTD
jgi:hypothetical protein